MINEDELEPLRAKAICNGCIEERYLSEEVKREGLRRTCAYCGRRRRSFTIAEVADRIDEVFSSHFERTSDQPEPEQQMAMADPESTYDWMRDGEPVVQTIANVAEIPEAAASDIQRILEGRHWDFEAAKMGDECEFADTAYYEQRAPDDRSWQEEWREFEHSLRSEVRFFSPNLADHLRMVFRDLDLLSASGGRPLLAEVGPGTRLRAVFRARAFQSDPPLLEALSRPDLHLGPPPAKYASSGRMNARGIAVFYGASSQAVAIAEVRPPVGSRVAVARFRFTERLRMLDLTALGSVRESGSLFDASLAERQSRAMFLRSLSARMTRAVMPDDEALDYLPTQAIAELRTKSAPRPTKRSSSPVNSVGAPRASASAARICATISPSECTPVARASCCRKPDHWPAVSRLRISCHASPAAAVRGAEAATSSIAARSQTPGVLVRAPMWG